VEGDSKVHGRGKRVVFPRNQAIVVDPRLLWSYTAQMKFGSELLTTIPHRSISVVSLSLVRFTIHNCFVSVSAAGSLEVLPLAGGIVKELNPAPVCALLAASASAT
jgi:hypothetical protein